MNAREWYSLDVLDRIECQTEQATNFSSVYTQLCRSVDVNIPKLQPIEFAVTDSEMIECYEERKILLDECVEDFAD